MHTLPQLLLPHLLSNHTITLSPGDVIVGRNTHTCKLTHTAGQVQADSAQYLGGYSGEGGALRDVFGYLQSLYPQGSKHQLLL